MWYDCPGAARAGKMTAPTPRPNNPPNSAPPSLTGTLALAATAAPALSHERFSFVNDDQLAVLSNVPSSFNLTETEFSESVSDFSNYK